MTKTRGNGAAKCRLTICHLAVVLLFSTASICRVSAQNIGNWTFNSNSLNGTPGLYNTVSIADFSPSVPIHSFNAGTEYFGENGWPTGAINTSMYLQFSLTPLSGYQIDISSLTLRMRRSNTGSPAGAGPNNWSLRSSLDGYTTDIATGPITYTYFDYVVNPGSTFLNLYSTVTFRLYGFNTTINTGGNSRLVMDNIIVAGLGYLLPLRIQNFAALTKDDDVHLSFGVAETQPGSTYIIEKSTDGLHFTSIHSGLETTQASEQDYSFVDESALQSTVSNLYYRLRIKSAGTDLLSSIIHVTAPVHALALQVKRLGNELHLAGNFPAEGSYQAAMYNLNGQLLTRIKFAAIRGYNNVDFHCKSAIPHGAVLQVTSISGGCVTTLVP